MEKEKQWILREKDKKVMLDYYETCSLLMFNYWLFLLIIIRSVMKLVGAYVFFRLASKKGSAIVSILRSYYH
jgi:hypothetical protein